ncbi:TonB-dependent receptor [Longibacter salinarum]|uniref:TonB-dependent receptor n=1 Tax=Longibacter salinarum TaxID=1850348 RepID=A0A2A8CVB8_9BACT|nr:TonB-dependent receptor [Longibacter salinarum]PEN12596.1 TonB-dependent receptor [Longibacter salinarum]
MLSHTLRHFVLLVGCLALTGLATVTAQDASVVGTVVDDSEAPVPGANVLIQSTERALQRGTTTDSDGAFSIKDLPAGTYTLRASFVGYTPVTERFTLQAGETHTVDIVLAAQRYGMNEVVISATRGEEALRSVPTSMSVLGPETMDAQLKLTTDVGKLLSQNVPGMAPATHTLSNYGQTLRGRSLFVLVDGVPQSAPLRNVLRDLHSIDPSAVERIEVVRGASATYGYGGNGGLVNFITKRPDHPGVHGEAEIGLQGQPSNVESSASGRLRGQVEVKEGDYDGLISATYEQIGYAFDGEGDRIPQDPQGQGGRAGSDVFNVLARGGVDLTSQQRLDLSANLYSAHQNLEYLTVPGTPDSAKARASAAGDIPGKDPGTLNLVANAQYSHDEVDALFDSRVGAQVFLQDYETRFTFASFYPDGGGQSVLESTKIGARADVETPVDVLSGADLTWGADLLSDRTKQPLEDGRSYVPPIHQWSAAPFAQLELTLVDGLELHGGARYESFWLSVDDFTTLFGGRDIEGGNLNYDAFVFNAGFVASLDQVDLFGNFSQGYSVADVGRVLRSPPDTTAFTVESLRPEAQKVNSYELGLRGGTDNVSASVTGFLNTSEFGSTLSDFPELQLVRAPERIYGIEATLDARFNPMRIGGTATFLEGKTDTDDDGDYETYLPGSRIPPAKLTGYVAYVPSDLWQVRAQVLHSGSRDRFDGSAATAFGQGDVDAYTVFDLSASVEAGPGTVGIGIENVFDTFYFPAISQWYNLGSGYAAAPGRQVRLSYTVRW